MQRQQIERGLHVVAVFGHRGLQCRGRVVGIGRPQRVGLVVQHPPAAAVFEHQVGKTHQHAAQFTFGQRRARRTGQQVRAAQRVDAAGHQPVAREPELHLRQQPIDCRERRPHRRQLGVEHRAEPDPHRARLVSPALLFAAALQLLLQFGRRVQREALAGQPFELVVQEAAWHGTTREIVPGRAAYGSGSPRARQRGGGVRQRAAGVHAVIQRSDRRRHFVVARRGHAHRPGQRAHQRGEAADRPASLEAGGIRPQRPQGPHLAARAQQRVRGVPGRLDDDAGNGLRQRFGLGSAARGVGRHAAAQHVADGAAVPGAVRARAHPQRRQTQPQGVPGARQRDIEQAQVLALPLAVGRGDDLGGQLQVQPAPAPAIGQPDMRRARLVHAAETGRVGQEDQRVFQALGLVHRDHLDEVGIAFQSHHLLVAGAAVALRLRGQPADQRLLAVEPGTRRLQQFGQVQDVGQAAFAPRVNLGRTVGAVRRRQPAPRQAQQVQRPPQHRQHALPLPDRVQLSQLLAACLEGLVVGGQLLQFGQRQAQRARGQRGVRQPCVQRRGHRLQQAQQVARLGAAEHRVLVRQVDRRHAAAAQRLAHGPRLAAVAHEHGNVGRPQAREAPRGVLETGAGVVEQGHDALGATLGEQAQVGPGVLQFAVQRQRDGGRGSVGGDERFFAAVRLHRHEGQRVVGWLATGGAEHEGALAGPRLGAPEDLVHRRHQRLCRAVVGVQHVVAPGGGAARGQVAVDVGAAKAVDRLLGVADQQQRGVARVVVDAVEAVEDARLQRRGVLEFVDQGHRGLRQDALA